MGDRLHNFFTVMCNVKNFSRNLGDMIFVCDKIVYINYQAHNASKAMILYHYLRRRLSTNSRPEVASTIENSIPNAINRFYSWGKIVQNAGVASK